MKFRSFLQYTFLIVACSLLQACFLFRPLPGKLYKRAVAAKPYDVIIVPGTPYNGKNWDFKMKGRVLWASYLIKNGIANNVIFSGAAVYTPYVEAKVMALYAEALGVSKEHIFIEDKAQHSTENLYYSYVMAKKLGFTKIALATDPFQSNLLRRFSKEHFKLPIAHIPFLVRILRKIDNVHLTINADSAKVVNFQSIKQTQSKRYRRDGTKGKHIVFDPE
jgi:hypothetical protein